MKKLFFASVLMVSSTGVQAQVSLDYCTDLLANQIIAFENYLADGAALVEVSCTKTQKGGFEMTLVSDCKIGGTATNTVGVAATSQNKGCEAYHFRHNSCPEFVPGAILDQQNPLESKKDYARFKKILKAECGDYPSP